jgi:hypothetical protein
VTVQHHRSYGNEIGVHQRTIALCRCGRWRQKPFCDGMHEVINLRVESSWASRRSGGVRDGAMTPRRPVPAMSGTQMRLASSCAGGDSTGIGKGFGRGTVMRREGARRSPEGGPRAGSVGV